LIAGVVASFRLELLLQLALGTLLGGVIGLERELKGKPAGLRTNMLICVGAVLFTNLSLQLSESRGDPARIAAQILPGVGFIGAGTILHLRGSVTGLTSAATIWLVAAIGMALGSRAYVDAVGTTVLVMVVLHVVGLAERALQRRLAYSRLTIHTRADAFEQVIDVVRKSGLEIDECSRHLEGPDEIVELHLKGPKSRHGQAMAALVRHDAVRSVSTGE
jgi:putative Mg2+ transporter-C (MgtC) family protein